MIRFRVRMLCIFGLVAINLSVGYSDTNIMRINGSDTRHGNNLLRFNNKLQDRNKGNGTEDEIEDYIPYDLGIVVAALRKLNDTQCRSDAATVLSSITSKERWALKMFDASSKFPVGILHGAFYQFGNFDECIGVKQPKTHLANSRFQGQYCLADVELFKKRKYEGRVARSFETLKKTNRNVFNSTIHWAICVPSSCSTEEVRIIVKEIFFLATEQPGISVQLNDDKCYFEKPQPITNLEIVYGCVVGVFLAFISVATVYHYYDLQQKKQRTVDNLESNAKEEKKDSAAKDALLCFSVIMNVEKFLHTKPSSLNLECICGIRCLSMLLIVCGHTLIFLIGGPVINTDFFDKESTSLANAIFLNNPLLVDTFLLISGFLMCYLLLIELDKRKGQLNILILYIARYIRLTPSYLVVIGLYCSYLLRMSSGPLWNSRIGQEQERCLKSWWTNLLYVNNYVNTDDMCMFQSWYLAVDYHLFIIAPFIVYPLWKWQKIGKSLLVISTIITIIIPFAITLKEKLDATLLVYAPEVYDLTENFFFKTSYIKTHMRASSYFLGLICGYKVYKLQTEGKKMSTYFIWVGWLVAAFCAVMSLFTIVLFYAPNHEYSAFESAIYASLHRVAWCIAIGWVLIVCITDHATLVNKFLSWKPFIPLSRLTYCAYLVNGFIEIYGFGSIREGTYMSKFELSNKSLSHAILTFSLAFVLCILFESPIHGLEKILLRRSSVRNKNDGGGNASDQSEVVDVDLEMESS